MPAQDDSYPLEIQSMPGIQRDTTILDARAHTDGQWVRWRNGRPRKIKGYRALGETTGLPRGINAWSRTGLTYIAVGSGSALEQITIDTSGNVTAPVLRTPTILTPSTDNLWKFDMIYDPTTQNNDQMLLGHAAPNATLVDNNSEQPIFWAPAIGTGALTPIGLPVLNSSFTVTTPTGTTAGSSNTITAVSSTVGISFGMMLSGPGIPANTHVTATTANTITMSQNAGGGAGTGTITVFVGGVSGGVLVIPPYILAYGSNGILYWNAPANSTSASGADFWSTGSGVAYIADQKIIHGALTRGGPGFSPAGLLWTLKSVIKIYFTGGSNTWGFDTLSDECSVLSPNSIAEMDGVFFWPGIDKFWTYDGLVRELPNSYNLDYFYNNLNKAARQKCFTWRDARWGEIWFCFPFGSSTECNAAIIYNKRENCWYDTFFPSDARSCCAPASVYPYPIMGDPIIGLDSKYKVYQHEIGTDEVNFNIVNAINSYYQTSVFTLAENQRQPVNNHISISMVEPDFKQVGDMTGQIVGWANARSPTIASETQPIVDPTTIVDSHQQVANFKTKRRQIALKFKSNVIGGDFIAGKIFAQVRPDDESTKVG